MKTWLSKIIILLFCPAILWSCEKDEDQTIVRTGNAPAVTASKTQVVLSSTDAANEAVAFTWTPADYGYKAAVKYTLELDKKGNNFAKPEILDVGSNQEKKFSVADFNALVNKLGLIPGVANDLEARVKSEISTFIQPVYSSALTLSATPYVVVIEYPSLYVPGAYQGWAPATAEKIASVKNDKVYEGYVYFKEAPSEFKFTSDPDWSHTNYGDSGNNTLSTDGGAGNLKVTQVGYYLLNANLNTNKWSATKMNWGVIGDATGTWDSDKDLIYDEATKTLKLTLDLTVGALKFRANDDWKDNYGDNKPADGKLLAGGENIPVTVAGKYEITLDLSKPGNYTYSLTKI